MAGCKGTREDGQLSHSKPGSHQDHHQDDDNDHGGDGDDGGDDKDAGAGDDGYDQAVRAAIEKMAEEGEVYTGVFTQVDFLILVLVVRRMIKIIDQGKNEIYMIGGINADCWAEFSFRTCWLAS